MGGQMFLTFILLTLFSQFSNAQEVVTETQTSGQYTYFYREDHPTQYRNGAICYEQQTKSDTKSIESEKQINTSNTMDEWKVKQVLDQSHGGYFNVISQVLAWNAIFDSEDYKFNISFEKQKINDQSFSSRRSCVNYAWSIKNETVSTDFKTHVSIPIPPNVYVMGVKTEINAPQFLPDSRIFQASREQIDENSSIEIKDSSVDLKNGYSYHFVRPGDTLQIEMHLSNTNDSGKLLAQYEITFFGQNSCEVAFEELGLAAKGQDLALRATDFKNFVSKIIASENQTAPRVIHNLMIALGCMTSKTNIANMIYYNDLNQLLDLIETTDSILMSDTKKLLSLFTGISQLKALVKMAQYSIAMGSLDSLRPLCKKYEMSNGKTYERGYERMSRQLEIISILLRQGLIEDKKTSTKSELIKSLKEIYDAAKDQRIDSKILYERLTILSKAFKQNVELKFVDEANQRFNNLPHLPPTEPMVHLATILQELRSKVVEYNSKFYYAMVDIAKQNEKYTPPIEQLTRLVVDIDQLYNAAQFQADSRFNLFGSNQSENLAMTVGSIDDGYLTPSTEWLKNAYGGFFNGFVKSISKTYQPLLEKETRECLKDPVGLL